MFRDRGNISTGLSADGASPGLGLGRNRRYDRRDQDWSRKSLLQ